MPFAVAFPCQKPSQIILANRIASTNVVSRNSSRRSLLKPRGTQIPKTRILETQNVSKYLINKPRKLDLITTLATNSDSNSVIVSLSETVKKVYTCINEKNLRQLEGLISNNCILEDSTFPYKFQGKKEVLSFFGELTESMGENVQFRIGHICEGDELTASVDWHLEWKEDQIPFSRGCSIFQCSEEGNNLVIKKAQIITESPIKPGKLAMGLLKILTSLFNDFPQAAKWFLQSPQAILQTMTKIYNLFLAPFVNPVLACYINLWKFIVRVLGYTISILHYIAKLLDQRSSSDDIDNSNSKTE